MHGVCICSPPVSLLIKVVGVPGAERTHAWIAAFSTTLCGSVFPQSKRAAYRHTNTVFNNRTTGVGILADRSL
jgi:hypothetical protein